MDINDLITLKQNLEADILNLLRNFRDKTGYMPNVVVDFYEINHLGRPAERIPQVKVTIEI